MADDKRMLLVDTFDAPSTPWSIDESADKEKSVVDGVGILGRAVGSFFAVNEQTQNKRFYPRSLWEKAIKDTEDDLKRGRMLGTIGHGQSLDEAALLEGKASHRVSRLWIDEKTNLGMGEILILNTPAGKVLNAYMRGGVEFPVSSRGYGEFEGKEEGVPVVNPETYKLETFDFVRNPGVEHAIPQLVEALQELDLQDNDSNELEEKVMEETKQLLEKLAEEKASIQAELTKALDENTSVKGKLEVAEGKLQISEKEIAELKTAAEASTATNEELTTKVAELEKVQEDYFNLGTPADIQKAFGDTRLLVQSLKDFGSAEDIQNEMATLADYKELGSVDELATSKESAAAYAEIGEPSQIKTLFSKLSEYAKLGTVEEITTMKDLFEQYLDLGCVDAISEVFSRTREYKERGSIAEVDGLIGLVKQYQEIGSVEEIMEVCDALKVLKEEAKERELKEQSAAFATEVDVSETVAEKLLREMSADEAKEIVESLKESKVGSRYKLEETTNTANVQEKKKESVVGMNSSRIGRLFESTK